MQLSIPALVHLPPLFVFDYDLKMPQTVRANLNFGANLASASAVHFRNSRICHYGIIGGARSSLRRSTFGQLGRCWAPQRSCRLAVQPPRAIQEREKDESSSIQGWRLFWGAVDTTAWLGAVGAAAAFVITQEAMLVAAPLVLPLLALYASKQLQVLDRAAAETAVRREVENALRLAAEASRATTALLASEVTGAAREAPREAVKTFEAKISSMEGSVLSTGAATREAIREMATKQGRAAREVSMALEALRRDLGTDMRGAVAEETAGMARLETRLGVCPCGFAIFVWFRVFLLVLSFGIFVWFFLVFCTLSVQPWLVRLD
jgi:hypothetical protein